MNFRRNLIKFTAVVSLFFTGASVISVNAPVQTVKADADTDKAVTTKKNDADAERDAVVALAKKQIGKPYVWGATGPYAFDCSGLTSYVFKNAINKNLPRTTYSQITLGKHVSMKKLKKGDLLFWGNHHVAIYIGNGKYVHAPAPGQRVKIQTLASFYPSSAKRVID